MKQMWNSRYSVDEYIYGKEPNVYFREQLKELSPAKCLLPAEGEGRNAIYAAKQGWFVDAFDYSETAKKKRKPLPRKKMPNFNFFINQLEKKSGCISQGDKCEDQLFH